MLRKIAVALIATTVLAAPAFAADATNAAKSASPAPAVSTAPADTATPTASTAGKIATSTVKTVKTDTKGAKVATRSHRYHSHRWYVAHRGKHPAHVMTAKVSHSVKHAKATPGQKPKVHEVKTNKAPASKPASQS